MLKVLQLIPTLDRSGAEKQMVLLAKGLPRDRFEVEVAALTRLGPLEADLRTSGIPLTLIGKRHKIDPLAYRRLVRILRAGRFDVLQTWIFAANAYGRLAARQARVPVLVTAEMAADLWKGRLELAIDRKLSGWTDRVVGNSRAVVDFYRKAGIPNDRLSMIYSGIENAEPPQVDPAEMRRELGLKPDAPLALFAGRLYPQKGVEDLLYSLDLLQHIRPNLRTLILGDGPLRGRLEATAKAFQLLNDRRVQFLGHREDVPRLLAASDLLVLPSRFEGLPNVVLEAMQASKPVVATAAPGTTELVVDRQTGLLVPIGDRKALASAIRDIIDAPDLARSYGEAGRARVLNDFQADQMIQKFADLYESLARSKNLLSAREPTT